MAFARRSTRSNTDLTQEKLHYVGWDAQTQKDVLDDFESEKGHSVIINPEAHSQKTKVRQDQENQSSESFRSKGVQKKTKERYVYAEGDLAGQPIPKNANIQRSGLSNNAKSYYVEEKNGKVIARHRVLCERYYLLKSKFVFDNGKPLTDSENKKVQKIKIKKQNQFYIKINGEQIRVRTLSAYNKSQYKIKNRKYSSLSFEDQDSVMPEIPQALSPISSFSTPLNSIEINTPVEQQSIWNGEDAVMEREKNSALDENQNQVNLREFNEFNREVHQKQENTNDNFFVADEFGEDNQESYFQNPIQMRLNENTLEQAPTNVDVLENPQLNSANPFYGSFAYQANSLFYCHSSSRVGQEFFQYTEDDMEINPEEIPFEPTAQQQNETSVQTQVQAAHHHQMPSYSSPSDEDFIDLLSGEAVALSNNGLLDWNLKSDSEENTENPKMRF